jgi:hypothetical protein
MLSHRRWHCNKSTALFQCFCVYENSITTFLILSSVTDTKNSCMKQQENRLQKSREIKRQYFCRRSAYIKGTLPRKIHLEVCQETSFNMHKLENTVQKEKEQRKIYSGVMSVLKERKKIQFKVLFSGISQGFLF